MKISNFSNVHGFATVRGWTKGTSATGGGIIVTDGTTTVSPATSLTVGRVDDGGSGDALVLPQIIGQGTAQINFTSTEIQMTSNSGDAGFTLADSVSGLFVNGTPGDQNGFGFNLEVGDDYVGLQFGEKDSSTVQVYPDSTYDVELIDATGKHWLARGDQYTTPLAGIPHVYRLPFAWNTASISTGVDIGTVKSGDLILGAWIDVQTAWNSTVSDAGDIYTATSSESLMNATVNMQSVGAGTDRRFLKDGALAYGQQAIMLSDQTIRVKVMSTGISLSAGAATAIVCVVRNY